MAFEFNLNEGFPHLSKAPIVEAALQINTRAGTAWLQERILPAVQRDLGGDARFLPENAVSQTFSVDPAAGFQTTGRAWSSWLRSKFWLR